MSLLLSNDDGVQAPGLAALAKALRGICEFSVIAPLRDCSGVSNSLTLDRPLHAEQLGNGYIGVDGTPTDCVHLGTAGLIAPMPERVIAGINHGPNMGDDVLYSGTVAAAMEGRFLDKPAMAVSLAVQRGSPEEADFERAARLFLCLLDLLRDCPAPPRTVFNINLPNVPAEKLQGLRITTLGQRLKSESPVRVSNPRGKTAYWIGRVGGPVDNQPDTDFHAVANGFISITPIHADMTRREVLAETREFCAARPLDLQKAMEPRPSRRGR